MKKNSYMDELRKLAGYDEDGNEIDEFGDVADKDANDNISENVSNEKYDSAEDDEETEPPYDTTDSIECKILLKAKDMRHFMFRHNYSSLSGWFGILISLIALVMVILGYNVYGNIQKIVLIILALMFTVIQPLQIVLKAGQQIKRQDMFHDTLVYNLCRDGLLVRQGDQHVNIPWDSIRKIVYTSKAVFIYTSPVRAFILPFDQIQSPDEVKHILQEKTR